MRQGKAREESSDDTGERAGVGSQEISEPAYPEQLMSQTRGADDEGQRQGRTIWRPNLQGASSRTR
jgi:hypothetical protein